MIFKTNGVETLLDLSFSEILRREGGISKPFLMSEGQSGYATADEGDPRRQAEILCTGPFPHSFADLYGNPLPSLSYQGRLLYLAAICPPEMLLPHLRAAAPDDMKEKLKRSQQKPFKGINTKKER